MMLLRKVNLVHFGKFAGREFELADLTIFCGENESGKTTICDAIGKCLHDKFRRRGEKLPPGHYARYGEANEVMPTWTEDIKAAVPHLSSDDIFRLYAIREGEARIDFDPDRPWLRQIIERLFPGGIAPDEVIEQLSAHRINDSRSKTSKEYKKCCEDLQKAKERREQAEADRRHLLDEERRLEKEREALATSVARAQNLADEIRRCKAEIAQSDKIKQRQEVRRMLRLLVQIEDSRAKLQTLAAFDDRQNDILAQHERSIAEAQRALAIAADRRKQGEDELQIASADLKAKKDALAKAKPLSETAEKLRNEIASYRPAVKTISVWNLPATAIALLAALAVGAVAFALLPMTAAIAALGVSLLAAMGVAVISRKNIAIEDGEAATAFLQRLKDIWFNAGGDTQIKDIATIAGALDFFANRIAAFRGEEEASRDLERKRNEREENLARRQREESQAREALKEAEEALAKWLRSLGIGSVAEYKQKRDAYRLETDRLAQSEREAGEAICRDLLHFKAECQRRLRELDAEGIPDQSWDENRHRELCRRYETCEREWHDLNEQIKKHTSDTSQSSGEIGVRIANVNKALFAATQEVTLGETRRDRLELDARAAEIAIDIFEEIKGETQNQFANLADAVAKLLGQIIPGSARRVKINDFQEQWCTDAIGAERQVENLSRGMRDTYYLAARLALALTQAAGQPRIVLLDEPFGALDETRETHLADMLLAFLREHNWQMVVFTKEKRLCRLLAAKAKDSVATIVYEYADGDWQRHSAP